MLQHTHTPDTPHMVDMIHKCAVSASTTTKNEGDKHDEEMRITVICAKK
jgi:hypothetical protein